jgi:hypothetical protein
MHIFTKSDSNSIEKASSIRTPGRDKRISIYAKGSAALFMKNTTTSHIIHKKSNCSNQWII